ncbi:MAG: esterase-like activity of phytase family protein [Sphingomonas sp.]
MASEHLRAALILLGLFSAVAGGEEPITRPHLDRAAGARSVSLHGQTFVNQGLAGAGRLAAGTVDFLGDTLGSFSSLQIAPGSWKRVGEHYEGVLWTLPDRGRNDPGANLFFDYPARLERLRVRFAPGDGRLDLVPDGGLELRDFRGRPFTGADPGAGTLIERGMVLPAPAGGVGSGKVSLDAEDAAVHARRRLLRRRRIYGQRLLFRPARPVARRDTAARGDRAAPRRAARFRFAAAPASGRRNNQGPEGVSLSPDGRTLFVALQSALVQDSATAMPPAAPTSACWSTT